MSYRLIRPLLFGLPPETAHNFSLTTLDWLTSLQARKAPYQHQPVDLMGLQFPNRIGLAAGLDKNAQHLKGLGNLGFGFIEVGTVTPKPQAGNPKPRMFRLPAANALINRMGFNNDGVDALIANVKKSAYRGLLGINIGKNATTPLEQATDDYITCLRAVTPYADYVTVNISSPNTAGLRQLQYGQALQTMLTELQQCRQQLAEQLQQPPVPLVVKIAPDLNTEELKQLADTLLEQGVSGVIATNTTLDRTGVEELQHGQEQGGLSGQPLRERATRIVELLHQHVGKDISIIAAGGIASVADAEEKFAAGASLVQIYTGLIYRGPTLVKELATSGFSGIENS